MAKWMKHTKNQLEIVISYYIEFLFNEKKLPWAENERIHKLYYRLLLYWFYPFAENATS